MAFRLNRLEADEWSVQDAEDQIVFQGSLDACEDWLDFQENEQRVIPRHYLVAWLKSFFASKPDAGRPANEMRPQQLRNVS